MCGDLQHAKKLLIIGVCHFDLCKISSEFVDYRVNQYFSLVFFSCQFPLYFSATKSHIECTVLEVPHFWLFLEVETGRHVRMVFAGRGSCLLGLHIN